MVAKVELMAGAVRVMLEGSGYKVYPTYPPESTSSHLFGANVGPVYVKVICLTQRITSDGSVFYLFYRNKVTKQYDVPEFSSVEFGYFDSSNQNQFVSLFKLHKIDADSKVISDEDYVAQIVSTIKEHLEGGSADED